MLHFSCDGLTARFDFTPIHPYALHVRSGMTFPSDFHNKSSLKLLLELPDQFSLLFESFRRSISVVQLTAEEVSDVRMFVHVCVGVYVLLSVCVLLSLQVCVFVCGV